LTNFEANAKQNEVKINRFSEELPADADETNVTRQVKTRFFLCYASNSIKSQSSTFFGGSCSTLGISIEDTKSNEFTNIFRKRTITPFRPYSMSYAGHQFGNWAGQLGDGRAIILAEIENKEQVYTLQLKGAV
jgi:uncharacterized protein YdiU (UPF0061 family)